MNPLSAMARLHRLLDRLESCTCEIGIRVTRSPSRCPGACNSVADCPLTAVLRIITDCTAQARQTVPRPSFRPRTMQIESPRAIELGFRNHTDEAAVRCGRSTEPAGRTRDPQCHHRPHRRWRHSHGLQRESREVQTLHGTSIRGLKSRPAVRSLSC